MSALAIALVLPSALYPLTEKAALIRSKCNSGLLRIIKSWLVDIIGYFLILVAFMIERVSYIVGLLQTRIIFAALMGSQLIKRTHGNTDDRSVDNP